MMFLKTRLLGHASSHVAWCFGLLGMCTAWTCQANDTSWLQLLPPEPVARQVLLQSPTASAALAQRRALEARADAIEAGSAEFTLRHNTQRRRVNEAATRYSENSTSLERPIRAWGKSGLDTQIAAQTRTVATIGHADAMHEASRTLIERWFDHLQQRSEHQLAQQQLAFAEQLMRQTQIRFRHGEVSQLDVSLIRADLLRTQSMRDQARAALAQSTAMLQQHYPQLPLPNVDLPTWEWPDTRTLAASKDTYLEHNHELRLLRADAQRLATLSERVHRDRWPDPSVGLFTASDRDGAERIQGVTLSIPLPGSARSAQAKAAYEEALAAQSRLQLAQAQWSAAFDAQTALVQARIASAQQLKEAAAAQTDAANKSSKAYSLGEGSMAELIQIQRNAVEQQRDAIRQALLAAQTWANLQLDLHLLWDMDE